MGAAALLSLGEDVALNAGRCNVRQIVAGENNAGIERLVLGSNATVSGENVALLNYAREGEIRFGDGAVVTTNGNGLA